MLHFLGKFASSAYSASASSYTFKSALLSPAHSILRDVFGYEHFRGPQEPIVAHVVSGGDALVAGYRAWRSLMEKISSIQ